MPRRNDRRVVLVLERCATEIDEADIGIAQYRSRLCPGALYPESASIPQFTWRVLLAGAGRYLPLGPPDGLRSRLAGYFRALDPCGPI